jgi:hypothetical protein
MIAGMMRNPGTLHTVAAVAGQIKKGGWSPLREGAKHEAMQAQRNDRSADSWVAGFGWVRLGRALRQPDAAVRLSAQPLQRHARSHTGSLALGGLVPRAMQIYLCARPASRRSDDLLRQAVLLPVRQSASVRGPELPRNQRHSAILLLSVAGSGGEIPDQATTGAAADG